MVNLRLKICVLSLFCFVSTVIFAQNGRDEKWREDIEYLKKELPKNHIDFFSVKSRSQFNSSLDAIAAGVNNKTDLEIAIRLQQVIASYGDSHTNINWSKFMDSNRFLPIYLQWLNDGIYILQTSKANEKFLGKKLLAINTTTVNTLVDSLTTLITADNKATVEKDIPKLMLVYQLLEYFNVTTGNELYMDVWDPVTNETLQKQQLIMPANASEKMEYVNIERDTVPFSSIHSDKLFAKIYFPDEQLYYIQYNKCWSKELEIKYRDGKNANRLPSFTLFEDSVLKDLSKSGITKLIFDLRRNSGGSSLQGTQFIEKIFAVKNVMKKMKVYVLIGKATYSSAIINAMDFKKYPNVIFVGEDTSGKPNHFGEVRRFMLPHSGLAVNYSTKYFKRTSDEVNTLSPDIPVSLSLSDIVKGIDPSLEYVKSQ